MSTSGWALNVRYLRTAPPREAALPFDTEQAFRAAVESAQQSPSRQVIVSGAVPGGAVLSGKQVIAQHGVRPSTGGRAAR
jgi:hypothetical protein